MGRNKQVKSISIVTSAREPRKTSDPISYYDINPSWRISRIELVDPYGWHTLDINLIASIKIKLSCFETMTWREILMDAKKQNHFVSISDLSSQAQAHLKNTGQDDIDQLVSLRLTGTQRVWGIWEKGVLNLLWWDPYHQVCSSKKKHT